MKPTESLSEHLEKLLTDKPERKKLKPKQRYEELKESRKRKRG